MWEHSNRPMHEHNPTQTELKTTQDRQSSIIDQNTADLLQLTLLLQLDQFMGHTINAAVQAFLDTNKLVRWQLAGIADTAVMTTSNPMFAR